MDVAGRLTVVGTDYDGAKDGPVQSPFSVTR
ncbi:hypothetical protein EDD39_1212 [Kitasatospora cineracea]|uniref:Uncharacterized protein n=1 Tax=Kitasatospora cineracea TaxID=88074 RepID=A0A8G1XCD2_9ACTN|nr:hypothetical protein EDD39_1212 [Kitasatospora cineracea]